MSDTPRMSPLRWSWGARFSGYPCSVSEAQVYACQNCLHWLAAPDTEPALGLCRRYPPRIIASEEDSDRGLFPVVRGDSRCGEWEMRP